MTVTQTQLYEISAWKDNNIKIVATQGEGISANNANGKTMLFQLYDADGLLSIPVGGSIQLAVERPDNSTDLLSGTVHDGENAVIKFDLTNSITQFAGHVKGEIRLINTNSVIKFYGINFLVYAGVSDDATQQSAEYSALVQALQSVAALDASDNIATLDTVIAHNGTNPVASGIIYDYLTANYYTKSQANDRFELLTNKTRDISDSPITTTDENYKYPSVAGMKDFAFDNFYTKDQIDDEGFLTQTDIDAEGFLTQTDIDAEGFLTQSDIADFLTQSDIDAEGFITHTTEIYFGTTDKTSTETGNNIQAYHAKDVYINNKNGKAWVCTNATEDNNRWVYSWTYKGYILDFMELKPTVIPYTLDSDDWVNNAQTLDISSDYTVTANTKADIEFSPSVGVNLNNAGTVGLYIENNAGVLTCKALGNAPNADITVQIVCIEVNTNS